LCTACTKGSCSYGEAQWQRGSTVSVPTRHACAASAAYPVDAAAPAAHCGRGAACVRAYAVASPAGDGVRLAWPPGQLCQQRLRIAQQNLGGDRGSGVACDSRAAMCGGTLVGLGLGSGLAGGGPARTAAVGGGRQGPARAARGWPRAAASGSGGRRLAGGRARPARAGPDMRQARPRVVASGVGGYQGREADGCSWQGRGRSPRGAWPQAPYPNPTLAAGGRVQRGRLPGPRGGRGRLLHRALQPAAPPGLRHRPAPHERGHHAAAPVRRCVAAARPPRGSRTVLS
jgi:hypothetical protein